MCFFKVDTGSDISLLNKKLVDSSKNRLPLENYNLKYPTGEEVAVEFKVIAKIVVGKFCLKFPFLRKFQTIAF